MKYLTLIFGLLSQWTVASELLRIATFDQQSPRIEVCRLVMEDIYKRLNISMELVHLPGKRAVTQVSTGNLDGALVRSAQITDHYPDMVSIPVPIDRVEVAAFARQPSLPISDWEGLSPYRIGILRGLMLIEEHTRHLPREIVSTPDNLFQMLDRGRVDIVVFLKQDGERLIAEHPIWDLFVYDLDSLPVYHFLHRKHSGLIEEMTALMIKMAHNGELQMLIKRSEAMVADGKAFLPEQNKP